MKNKKTTGNQQFASLITIGLLLAALSALLILTSCGAGVSPAATGTTVSPSSSDASSTTAASDTTLKEFTVDELAKFDGQNGNPAYIAVDGNVYDVSNAAPWQSGSHFGKYTAGKDLSKVIVLVSHGKSKLSEVHIIGTLK